VALASDETASGHTKEPEYGVISRAGDDPGTNRMVIEKEFPWR
jgi:hypothetical protein